MISVSNRVVLALGVLLLSGMVAVTARAATDVTGAGGTLPYPLYAKWAEVYYQSTGNQVNYQPMGSGAGIRQIMVPTVTFGGSDMPLDRETLKNNGLVQWPMIIGGIVPVIHIDGVKPGQLVLDGPTLAAIYLGEIRRWNDPRIKQLNPTLSLPDQLIAPVYRADGSGTSYLFTSYLAAVSPKFRARIGVGASVAWPIGLGAKGNQGVANMTLRTAGAIGYVQYTFAKVSDLDYAAMKNRAGEVVMPKTGSFQAAAANADWAKTPELVNEPGAASWPITGASFILMQAVPRYPEQTRAALRFFAWAYQHGDGLAIKLGYVPLPNSVTQQVERRWTEWFEWHE